MIETAEKRGVKTCGHNADQSSLAPKGFITGAELKWAHRLHAVRRLIAKGEKLPNVNEGGYDKDMVQSTTFGAGASEAAKAAATKAIAEIKGGRADLRRSAEGQHRQGGSREDARPLRSGTSGARTTWSRAW